MVGWVEDYRFIEIYFIGGVIWTSKVSVNNLCLTQTIQIQMLLLFYCKEFLFHRE